MTQVFKPNEWFRKNFSSVPTVLDTPPLMRLQTNSYDEFLQKDVPPAKREEIGLQAVFNSVFPIYDFNKTVSLEFVSYSLEEPKYNFNTKKVANQKVKQVTFEFSKNI